MYVLLIIFISLEILQEYIVGENLITNATKKSTFRVDVMHVNLRQRLLFVSVTLYLWQIVAGGRDRSTDPNQITGTVPLAAVCQGNNAKAQGRVVCREG